MAKQKKKRSKRYNLIKAANLIAAEKLSKNFLVFVKGCGEYVNLFTNKGVAIDFTPEIGTLMVRTRQRWSVTLYAILRDHSGREYLQSEAVHFKTEMFHSELCDVLNDYHKHFLDHEVNRNHLITAGWFASHKGIEPDDAVAMKCFKQLGAFEFTAQWEAKEMECSTH